MMARDPLGPMGPPKEMAPAGKPRAIPFMIIDNASPYRANGRAATAEVHNG